MAAHTVSARMWKAEAGVSEYLQSERQARQGPQQILFQNKAKMKRERAGKKIMQRKETQGW